MKTAKTSNRRNFLLATGAGTVGVAAAVVGAGKVAAPTAAKDEAAKVKGYHVSAHIQKYYRTTET